MERTIVIFANSVKNNAHCVAGKCIQNLEWIRPVSTVNGTALSANQIKCKNPYGSFAAKTLQRVRMRFEQHTPLINQPENYLISSDTWVQDFKIELYEISKYLDNLEDIWGKTDRVNYGDIKNEKISIKQSLCLLQINNLKLYLNRYNKRRAIFNYKNITYDLAATDPNFDNLIKQYQFPISSAMVCVSLGEPYTDGQCYKIVAGIFIV